MLLLLFLLPSAALADYYVTQSFSTPSCAAGTETVSPDSRVFFTGGCRPLGNTTSIKLNCGSGATGAYTVYLGTTCSGASSQYSLPLPGCDGRGNGASCVPSPLAFPDVSALGDGGKVGLVKASFTSCPVAAGAPLSVANLTNATQAIQYKGFPSPGCVNLTGPAPLASMQFLCGPWGAGVTYYSDAACQTPAYSPALTLTPADMTCTQTASEASAFICLSPVAAAPALTSATCKGATLPTSLAETPLKCYRGVTTSSSNSSVTLLEPVSGDYGICAAMTVNCSNAAVAGLPICQSFPAATIRYYFGAANSAGVLSTAASVGGRGADLSACTTPLCNAPSTDACAIATSAYTPLACAAHGAVNTTVSAAPIACFSNLPSGGAPVLQAVAVPGSAFCMATTVSCASATAPLLKAACGNSTAGAVRVYSGA